MSDEAQQVEETYEQHILHRIAVAVERIAYAEEERNAALRREIASRQRRDEKQDKQDAFIRRTLEGGSGGNQIRKESYDEP